jgi:hypothetical protein
MKDNKPAHFELVEYQDKHDVTMYEVDVVMTNGARECMLSGKERKVAARSQGMHMASVCNCKLRDMTEEAKS